jgi:hypothetical protein
MAADARRPAKKAFPNVALALTDAWPHYEADMIRLSPLGSVAYILANRAITLTNDRESRERKGGISDAKRKNTFAH